MSFHPFMRLLLCGRKIVHMGVSMMRRSFTSGASCIITCRCNRGRGRCEKIVTFSISLAYRFSFNLCQGGTGTYTTLACTSA